MGSIYTNINTFTPTQSNPLYNNCTIGCKSEKVRLHLLRRASEGRMSLLLREVQMQAGVEESVGGEDLPDTELCWAPHMLKAARPLHSLWRIGVLRRVMVSMDFSPPLLDSGGPWRSPRPPVSPVWPPAVCREKPSPALWHCAPVLWP